MFYLSKRLQKQPSTGILRKRCSENTHKFTAEHPLRGAISIKLQSNFIDITLWHGCSAVNLCVFSEHLCLRHTSRGLLLGLVHKYFINPCSTIYLLEKNLIFVMCKKKLWENQVIFNSFSYYW